MFSVIFEVFPKAERFAEYLALAKELRPLLTKIDGFVDNERFESKRRPGWILSHSAWRDEKSLVRWRTARDHHMIQERGRSEVLQDYRIRVGNVTADTEAPTEALVSQQCFDETEVGVAKLATLTEITPQAGTSLGLTELACVLDLDLKRDDVLDSDFFASIYNPGKMALLLSWKDAQAGNVWTPCKPTSIQTLRHRKVRIIRDYGMFDRRESPQFFPDAKGRETKDSRPVS